MIEKENAHIEGGRKVDAFGATDKSQEKNNMQSAVSKKTGFSTDVATLTERLRAELLAHKDNIPSELKARRGWLAWRVTFIDPDTGKFNKIPVYPRSGKNRSGTQGSQQDLDNLGTWDDVRAALNADDSLAGVGFALLPRFGVVALDADKCVTDGKIRADVGELTKLTYTEISPSGTGTRSFWLGRATNGKNHDNGFELFHANGFVTVTGQRVENFHSMIFGDSLAQLDDAMRNDLQRLARSAGGAAATNSTSRLQEAAMHDLRLRAIRDAGLYERDMGDGKHSITCPFEPDHSDYGRPGGDGDTVYFQPNTNGFGEGHIHCSHTHGNDQDAYWREIAKLAGGDFDTLDGKPRSQTKFPFMSCRDLLRGPKPVRWLLRNWMEAGSLALLFGESMAGKSFLALDWGCCIAKGLPWNGHNVQQGAVFYIAGEGKAGIGRRIDAWGQAHGVDMADAPIYVSERGAALMDCSEADSVAEAIRALAAEHGDPALVVVDTLHRNFGAGDENSASDIATFLSNIDNLIRLPLGCAVLVVHHSGHANKDHSRGSSAIRAALDAEFKLVMDGELRELTCTKQKDAEPPKPMALSTEVVTLAAPWLDDDGEFLTSLVLRPTTAPSTRRAKPLTGGKLIAMKALRGLSGEYPERKVPLDAWRSACFDLGISESEKELSKQKAFNRAKESLVGEGRVDCGDGCYWDAEAVDFFQSAAN